VRRVNNLKSWCESSVLGAHRGLATSSKARRTERRQSLSIIIESQNLWFHDVSQVERAMKLAAEIEKEAKGVGRMGGAKVNFTSFGSQMCLRKGFSSFACLCMIG